MSSRHETKGLVRFGERKAVGDGAWETCATTTGRQRKTWRPAKTATTDLMHAQGKEAKKKRRPDKGAYGRVRLEDLFGSQKPRQTEDSVPVCRLCHIFPFLELRSLDLAPALFVFPYSTSLVFDPTFLAQCRTVAFVARKVLYDTGIKDVEVKICVSKDVRFAAYRALPPSAPMRDLPDNGTIEYKSPSQPRHKMPLLDDAVYKNLVMFIMEGCTPSS
ncbi:hypothetical protein NEOLEDRAFT_1173991 [Neolentinus lepideus HHB14362 ss-1]|uniref:Uncharacterized protein n=1 Tax=Neolentinus lepideus HHB14362 ss-1 TaxID=1314782 RepID=A0A165W2S6_9AGAM|nr:hypothetical protein NEOLEDRAFT_1173991 [Neolentinus lepideus HHB14362 ss-1]